jgi:hypothetical protein
MIIDFMLLSYAGKLWTGLVFGAVTGLVINPPNPLVNELLCILGMQP